MMRQVGTVLFALLVGAPATAIAADAAAVKTLISEGDAFANEAKWDEALAKYQAARKLDPTNYETLVSLASVFQSQKKYGESIPFWKEAAAAKPDEADAWKGLAATAISAKSWPDAEVGARELTRIDAGAPEPERIRCEISIGQEKWSEAYRHIQASLRLDPRVKRGKSLLAYCALKAGKKDEAMAVVRSIAEISPRGWEAIQKDKRFDPLHEEAAWKAIQSPPIPDIAEGKLAPAFDLARLDSGRATLEAYRGRLVLVNFWASW